MLPGPWLARVWWLAGGLLARAALARSADIGKDCVEMAACASVLVDAYKRVREFPSTAEDSGEAERTAKHFAQYAINHAHMELTATQAAGVVLRARVVGRLGRAA